MDQIKEEAMTYGEVYRRTFKLWQKGHWKESQTGFAMSVAEAKTIAASFEWFHGTKSEIVAEELIVSHKDGLVTFTVQGYKVTSPGYGA